MDLAFSKEDLAFRDEVRAFIAEAFVGAPEGDALTEAALAGLEGLL